MVNFNMLRICVTAPQRAIVPLLVVYEFFWRYTCVSRRSYRAFVQRCTRDSRDPCAGVAQEIICVCAGRE